MFVLDKYEGENNLLFVYEENCWRNRTDYSPLSYQSNAPIDSDGRQSSSFK